MRSDVKNVKGLVCKECGRGYPVAAEHVCDLCFGPLEVSVDLAAAARSVTPGVISSGPPTMWRYAPLLPAPRELVDLGAGLTPLRPAPRLAAELGLRRLWVKNDAANPTHSFKDRVVSVALSVARAFGYEVVACASTGNLANAVAAHAAAAGMQSVVLVPRDLEAGKLAATTVYGGTVLAVDGSYDDVNRLCIELAGSRPWAFVNVNMRPYYAEGSKTIAFEIVEQLGWRAPDAVVVPIAAGSLLTKVGKGLRELRAVGLLAEPAHTRIFGAQAEGCSPVARAFAEGATEVAPMKANTVAKSLAIGSPADGPYALAEVRASGGAVSAVAEDAVADGIRLLARTEGLFTETAGGVTVAALEQMVRSGRISSTDETVAVITGTGLKTIEALEDVSAARFIRPVVEEVDAALDDQGALAAAP
jgi:threonine synthase